MKKILMTAVATLALTAPAWAQADLDANGDGVVTLDEVQAVNPDVTAEDFSEMDTDSDGVLSPEEVSAAEEAGQLGGDAGAADDGAADDGFGDEGAGDELPIE